jgi:hypothetical protein
VGGRGRADVDPATDIRQPDAGVGDFRRRPIISTQVFEALGGPKRLILVPGARHNQALGGPVWSDVEQWLDAVLRGGFTRS